MKVPVSVGDVGGGRKFGKREPVVWTRSGTRWRSSLSFTASSDGFFELTPREATEVSGSGKSSSWNYISGPEIAINGRAILKHVLGQSSVSTFMKKGDTITYGITGKSGSIRAPRLCLMYDCSKIGNTGILHDSSGIAYFSKAN